MLSLSMQFPSSTFCPHTCQSLCTALGSILRTNPQAQRRRVLITSNVSVGGEGQPDWRIAGLLLEWTPSPHCLECDSAPDACSPPKLSAFISSTCQTVSSKAYSSTRFQTSPDTPHRAVPLLPHSHELIHHQTLSFPYLTRS